MEQTALPEIVSIISQKTGVSPADTARVINYYLRVLTDSARRLTVSPVVHATQPAEKVKKYPRQLDAIRRPTATLCFDAYYSEPSEDAGSFLETPAYDRIKITLVDVSDKNKKFFPEANIQADDWHGIRLRSMRAFYNAASPAPTVVSAHEATRNPSAPSTVEPQLHTAYTLKFSGGVFDGFTPAAVLIKWPSRAGELRNVAQVMERDSASLPRNKAYIDAIKEALALFERGELDRQATIAVMTGQSIPAAMSSLPADTSAAYTRKFKMGDLKGKSPADVLLENPDAAEKLKGQKDFLAKNLEKFPANKLLIEAIDLALALHSSGKLSKEAAAHSAATPDAAAGDETAGATVIYDSSWRAPQSHKKDNSGLSKVYRVLITHDSVSKPKYPWKISISNGRSLCKHADNGRLIIGEICKDDTFITRYLNISDDEWMTVLRKVELSYNRFYGDMFSEQYRHACDYTDAKRKAALEKRDA